jgi:hypothetical protein
VRTATDQSNCYHAQLSSLPTPEQNPGKRAILPVTMGKKKGFAGEFLLSAQLPATTCGLPDAHTQCQASNTPLPYG